MGRSSDRSVAVRSSASSTRFAVLVPLVMVTVLAVILVTPRIVHACSCGATTLSDYADRVNVAFVGRQIESTGVSGVWGVSVLLLEVDRVYKGRAGPLIEVRTDDSATCGAHFGGMGTTGVAVMRNDVSREWEGIELGDLYVGWCTAHVSIEELEEVFGAGYPPDETLVLEEPPDATLVLEEPPDATLVLEEPSESSTPSRTLLVGGAAFVLLAAVVGLVRLRRRTVG